MLHSGLQDRGHFDSQRQCGTDEVRFKRRSQFHGFGWSGERSLRWGTESWSEEPEQSWSSSKTSSSKQKRPRESMTHVCVCMSCLCSNLQRSIFLTGSKFSEKTEMSRCSDGRAHQAAARLELCTELQWTVSLHAKQ